MPELVPCYGITVMRDGKMVHPPIGKPFNFTDDEAKAVRSHRHDALRKPINESSDVVARTETDLELRDQKIPDADGTRDANLLRRAKAKAGGKARNQGGSQEEDDVAHGGAREEDVSDAPPDDSDDL